MPRGSRRSVVGLVVCGVLGVILSGCAAVGSIASSDAAGVAIGEQALGTASSSSTTAPSTGWSSTNACPDSLRQGLVAGLPAGATLSVVDSSSSMGVPADPTATQGDYPSCVFALVSGAHTVNEEFFVGMPDSYVKGIDAKLVADGFTAGTPTPQGDGTQQVFTALGARVAVEQLSVASTPVIVVIG
jgi:hypothetical protein